MNNFKKPTPTRKFDKKVYKIAYEYPEMLGLLVKRQVEKLKKKGYSVRVIETLYGKAIYVRKSK